MSILYTRAMRETPLTDVPALVDQIVWELNDRRFLGRTSARQVAAGKHYPFAIAPAWLELSGHEVDDDNIPLAWSCWEMSTALCHRLHAEGIYASVHTAHGVEDGATGEPHAVVLLEGLRGETYLADPYFDVGAVLYDPWQNHSWTGPHATAVTIGNALTSRGSRNTNELVVRHVAFPRPYRYRIVDDSNFTETYRLISDAPCWVGAEGRRSLRTTIDHVVIRVTEKNGDGSDEDSGRGVETKVWDLSHPTVDPTVSWTSPSWVHAAREIVELTQTPGPVTLATVRRSRIRSVIWPATGH